MAWIKKPEQELGQLGGQLDREAGWEAETGGSRHHGHKPALRIWQADFGFLTLSWQTVPRERVCSPHACGEAMASLYAGYVTTDLVRIAMNRYLVLERE